jgi:hypothetical protein
MCLTSIFNPLCGCNSEEEHSILGAAALLVC